MTIRRLIPTALSFSVLSIAAISGCGGGSDTATSGAPPEVAKPPSGFQEQQKSIGGNMMDAKAVTTK